MRTEDTGERALCPLYPFDCDSETVELAGGIRIERAPDSFKELLSQRCLGLDSFWDESSKVMSLSSNGAVQKFEMNDRCSAGIGKFLEIMASTLEVGVDELGELALSTSKPIHINSLCTVFAESEVVSLIARGEESNAIALGLHKAIATRIVGMVRRTGFKERVVFAGGAALNTCLRKLIEEKLGIELSVPSQPQIVGAFGAALLTRREHKQRCIAN